MRKLLRRLFMCKPVPHLDAPTVATDQNLKQDVELLLKAFELAEVHAKGRSYKERLSNQMDVALSILDWAICESDRGAQLLKEKTRADYR